MKSPTCLYTNAVNFSLVSVVQVMDDVIELGRWYVHGMHLVFSKSENASVVFFCEFHCPNFDPEIRTVEFLVFNDVIELGRCVLERWSVIFDVFVKF